MSRWLKAIWVFVAIVAMAGWAATLTAQSSVPELTGVWVLNAGASTNPDGPPPPARGGTRKPGGGGGGSSGGGGGGDEGGGGPANRTDATTLSGDEQKRFNAMKAMVFKAPPVMQLEATATDFKMLLDQKTNFGFQHKLDNKKQSLTTPAGPADFKAKWDGKKVHRELEAKETPFRCVEEYSLSPDGKQLIVTVKADSGMVRNVQTADIKRVYDRQK